MGDEVTVSYAPRLRASLRASWLSSKGSLAMMQLLRRYGPAEGVGEFGTCSGDGLQLRLRFFVWSVTTYGLFYVLIRPGVEN